MHIEADGQPGVPLEQVRVEDVAIGLVQPRQKPVDADGRQHQQLLVGGQELPAKPGVLQMLLGLRRQDLNDVLEFVVVGGRPADDALAGDLVSGEQVGWKHHSSPLSVEGNWKREMKPRLGFGGALAVSFGQALGFNQASELVHSIISDDSITFYPGCHKPLG